MTSRPEDVANRSLLAMLSNLRVGDHIEDSEDCREFQSALELFLSECLAGKYPSSWRGESLDAFRFARARKVGPDEAEFLGVSLLISDQTWTPFRAFLKVSSTDAGFERVSFTLGEADELGGGIVRIPFASSNLTTLLFRLADRSESVVWTYSFMRTGTGRH